MELLEKLKKRYPSRDIKLERHIGPDDMSPRTRIIIDGVIMKTSWNQSTFEDIKMRWPTSVEEVENAFFTTIDEQLQNK